MKLVILFFAFVSFESFACDSQLEAGREHMRRGLDTYHEADRVMRRPYNYDVNDECADRAENIEKWESALALFKYSENNFTFAKQQCRSDQKKQAIQGIESAKNNVELTKDTITKLKSELSSICERQRSVNARKVNVCNRYEWGELFAELAGAYSCSEVLLDKITKIDLKDVRVGTIPNNVFSGLVNLEDINLENSGISTLPENLFEGLPKLRIVRLNNNQIKILPRRLFALAPSLVYIGLHKNQIKFLPADLISKNMNLEVIRLDENQIEAIPLAFLNFQDTVSPKFAGINLSSNKISVLHPKMFAWTPNLKEIYINSNSIEVLPEKLLKGLSILNTLELSGNKILSIPADFFESEKFKVINFNQNSISKIDTATFSNLKNLQDLHFQGNKIGVLPSDLLKGMPLLNYFNFAENNVYEIPDGFFSANNKLSTISFWGNHISVIPYDLFFETRELKELYLTQNYLREVPTYAIKNLSKLEILTMRNNLIEEIAPYAFDGLKSLKTLGLKENKIKKLSAQSFAGLSSLSFLDFGGNVIEIPSRQEVGLNPSVKIQGNICFGVISVIAEIRQPNDGTIRIGTEYLYLSNPFEISCDELAAPNPLLPGELINKYIKTDPSRTLIDDEAMLNAKYVISKTKAEAEAVFLKFGKEALLLKEHLEINEITLVDLKFEL